MKAYADTGFLASLFLMETTSRAAETAVAGLREPLPVIPLTALELRNAFNLAIARRRIDRAERDALWQRFETEVRAGTFVPVQIAASDLHGKARELSDRHTPTFATRSLDLLHVAAALLLGAKTFFSFDDRQRRAAAAEGLRVRP
jgi:hypothetical protein